MDNRMSSRPSPRTARVARRPRPTTHTFAGYSKRRSKRAHAASLAFAQSYARRPPRARRGTTANERRICAFALDSVRVAVPVRAILSSVAHARYRRNLQSRRRARRAFTWFQLPRRAAGNGDARRGGARERQARRDRGRYRYRQDLRLLGAGARLGAARDRFDGHADASGPAVRARLAAAWRAARP